MGRNYTAPDPDRSVLLTIDVQRDFAEPGAVAEIPGTYNCLAAMRRLVEAYRRRGLPIVHVVRLYLTDGTNADLCRRETIEGGRAIVAPGTEGSQIVESVLPSASTRLDPNALLSGALQPLADNEWAMYKPRWDTFFGTALQKHLNDLAVTTVVVVGCNFPNCPRATLYGASMRDFRAVLISDAVSGVYERGLEELSRIGVSTPSAEEYLQYLQSNRPGVL